MRARDDCIGPHYVLEPAVKACWPFTAKDLLETVDRPRIAQTARARGRLVLQARFHHIQRAA